jgi:hypothetical protein
MINGLAAFRPVAIGQFPRHSAAHLPIGRVDRRSAKWHKQLVNPMEIEMTVITFDRTPKGWTATFKFSPDMPNGTPLPLPFSAQASAEMVRSEIRKRFPDATFVTKAGAR